MKHVFFFGAQIDALDANDGGFLTRVNRESIPGQQFLGLIQNNYGKYSLDVGVVINMIQGLYGLNIKLKAVRMSILTNSSEYIICRYRTPEGADGYNITSNKGKIYVKANKDGGFDGPIPTIYYTAAQPVGGQPYQFEVRLYVYFEEHMMTGAIRQAGDERVQIGVSRFNM